MAELGHYTLLLAFLVCWYTVFASFIGARRGSRSLIESAYRGVWSVFGLLTISSMALMYLLAVRDLNVEYVARYTSSLLPMYYAIPAFWAGNAGSLLLWVWVLSGFSAVTIYRHRNTESLLIPNAGGVLMVISAFFLFLIIFLFQVNYHMTPDQVTDPFYRVMQAVLGVGSQGAGALHPTTNPFWRLPFTPEEGMGLNPQLQNPGMLFHPPTLYLGYVGMAIPFAFGMAALITRKVGNEWLLMTRRWTITAWFFLSIGNILGGWWAYVTLGWGGYWAWDPVENAALIPWLLATAFLHSVMIQEKRGMLKIWNMVLIIAAFTSTIFGTYLTRSGIIASVHSFARNEAFNISFLLFLALCIGVALYFLITRLDLLQSEHRLDSLISRESAFLYNNVALVGAAFVVLFGTMFPLISQWFRGVQVSVGPIWFNSILWPVWALLLLLTGVGPLIAWRKADTENLKRNFLWPTVFGALIAASMPFLGILNGYAIGFFGLCGFVLATIVQEFYRGTRTRMRLAEERPVEALTNLIVRQNRRYGGYVIHLGVIMITVGIVASWIYQSETDLTFQRGAETQEFAGYGFQYVDFRTYPETHRDVFAAKLLVHRKGMPWQEVEAVREYYRAEDMNWTKPAILHAGLTDIYITLASWSGDRSTITVNVKKNPLVNLLWIGGTVLIIGTVIAMWPDKRERMHRTRKESRRYSTRQPVAQR